MNMLFVIMNCNMKKWLNCTMKNERNVPAFFHGSAQWIEITLVWTIIQTMPLGGTELPSKSWSSVDAHCTDVDRDFYKQGPPGISKENHVKYYFTCGYLGCRPNELLYRTEWLCLKTYKIASLWTSNYWWNPVGVVQVVIDWCAS